MAICGEDDGANCGDGKTTGAASFSGAFIMADPVALSGRAS